MQKCYNFVCLNKVKGGRKEKDQFCRSCRLSSQPYVFLCDISDSTFTHNGRGRVGASGCIPLSCSIKCKAIKHSLLSKARYRKKHPIKSKKCPTCKKTFKKAGSKYCSKGCYPCFVPKYRKLRRNFNKIHSALKTSPYLK